MINVEYTILFRTLSLILTVFFNDFKAKMYDPSMIYIYNAFATNLTSSLSTIGSLTSLLLINPIPKTPANNIR
ncbi:Uncharacterised protein [Streptococcus pneumoniae]|nr:Uncharacterised protein [Streptococcus pneumoniae]